MYLLHIVDSHFAMNKENISKQDKERLREAIVQELNRKPPVVGLIGVSGVGKTSTINTLFKANLPISHTTAGTKKFESLGVGLPFVDGEAKGMSANLKIIDAPGLGESINKDPFYLEMYKKHLPECDVILWVLAARNRALALDQMYLRKLSAFHDRMVFGINQVDLVEPISWSKEINLPFGPQEENINDILVNRKELLEEVVGREVKIIAYSAQKRYRLQELFTSLIQSMPEKRAWIYSGLKNFRYDDFIPTNYLEKKRKDWKGWFR